MTDDILRQEKILSLRNINEELSRLNRRIDEMQKSLDSLFADRKILEELLGSIAHLKELVLSNQKHQDNLQKDVKAEVIDTKLEMKDKVTELQEDLSKRKIIRIAGKRWWGYWKR